MESLINFAKKELHAFEGKDDQPQEDGGGGEVRDRRYHETQAVPELDEEEIVKRAKGHVGHDKDSAVFANAMRHVSRHDPSEHTRAIDEEHITKCHKEAYENDNASSLDADGMGTAAALKALQMFTSGEASGGDGSSQLISLAMGEASKLFDSSGGASSGSKQDAVTGAAMTMMKIVVQSKLGGGGIFGGSDKPGFGTMLSLASKLM